ncbi:hypothetical protein EIP91_005608 [Steccherinum ochraceum]|uniref:DUF6593 domain-containing protein n=1 Tax=Steccherinum ochraceum TaxID=92696 RepID=A0A4V6N733_9APHY|nr:hypothetical protein EIP91_005608 [Steccherinum ochraceum]
MSTSFGIHLLLNDKVPTSLTDSEFVDMYDRLRLRVHCTLRNADRTVIMIYKSTLSAPIACLEFGAGHALGSIKLTGKDPVHMNDFLSRVSRSSRVRRFIASDGQTYTWTQESKDSEWEASEIAIHALAHPNVQTSAMLAVDEGYTQITGELVATLLIMRHIVKYNL